MAHIGSSPEGYDDYIIRSCTNNGVWVVENQNIQYDFLNKEYTAEGITTEFGDKSADMQDLRKNLNKALLR